MKEKKAQDSNKKLLCFSHAGSSATIFHQWDKIFYEKGIEIIPVELPGRGLRSDEPLCQNIDEVVQDIFIRYKKVVEQDNYALFGHSMGCLILYEFCKYCNKQNIALPLHVFVSGRGAPHIRLREKKTNMTDEDFMQEIYKLGGCDEELINDSELMRIFLPILRNDYALVEKYVAGPIVNFKCGITVLNGLQDTIADDELKEWAQYTNEKFEIINFKGGHFYLFDYPKKIARIVMERLFV